MSSFLYFAYGSNMLLQRLKERCSSAVFQETVYVDGYSLNFSKKSIDDSGKATIKQSGGGRVYGTVFELKDDDLERLDKAEGNGKGYTRNDDFRVRSTITDHALQVSTYIADHGSCDQSLRPYDWYLDLVIAGARQHSLPEEYIENLVSVEAVEDLSENRTSKREARQILNDAANN